MKTFKLIALAMLIFVLPAGMVIDSGGGPSPSQTLDDQFASDITDWTCRNGSTCANVSGTLEVDGNGAAIYAGSSEGSQPSSRDQWAAARWASDFQLRGIGLRAQTATPDNTKFNYTLVCFSGFYRIQVCDSDTGNCEDVGKSPSSNCDDQPGRGIAFMVAGEGTATELCAFDLSSSPSDTAFVDPSDETVFGFADYCVSSTGNTPLLDSFTDGSTAKEDWDNDGGAPDSGSLGYPASGQTDVTAINLDTGNDDMDFFVAGDLNL